MYVIVELSFWFMFFVFRWVMIVWGRVWYEMMIVLLLLFGNMKIGVLLFMFRILMEILIDDCWGGELEFVVIMENW